MKSPWRKGAPIASFQGANMIFRPWREPDAGAISRGDFKTQNMGFPAKEAPIAASRILKPIFVFFLAKV